MTRRRRARPAPEVTRVAFPLIAALLRGYLHEDWPADYETAEQAREAFLADASPEERRAFARECEAFHALTAGLSMADLRTVLHESLGGAWEPVTPDEVRQVLRPRATRA